MTNEHEFAQETLGADFWNERYRSQDRIWSGRPNRHPRGGPWTWAVVRAPTPCGWRNAVGR
jgi:hypothetical protein